MSASIKLSRYHILHITLALSVLRYVFNVLSFNKIYTNHSNNRSESLIVTGVSIFSEHNYFIVTLVYRLAHRWKKNCSYNGLAVSQFPYFQIFVSLHIRSQATVYLPPWVIWVVCLISILILVNKSQREPLLISIGRLLWLCVLAYS